MCKNALIARVHANPPTGLHFAAPGPAAGSALQLSMLCCCCISALANQNPEFYSLCCVDGSGFTRILQSLALMCSNKPSLPMTFGADHLHPAPVSTPLDPLTPKASGHQHQQHCEATDPPLRSDLVCQSERMTKLKAELDSCDQQALTQVLLWPTPADKLMPLAHAVTQAATSMIECGSTGQSQHAGCSCRSCCV